MLLSLVFITNDKGDFMSLVLGWVSQESQLPVVFSRYILEVSSQLRSIQRSNFLAETPPRWCFMESSRHERQRAVLGILVITSPTSHAQWGETSMEAVQDKTKGKARNQACFGFLGTHLWYHRAALD